MKKIEINIPVSLFEEALQKYGSRKKIEDIISVRLERNVRRNRRLISKPEHERSTTISIYVKDHIYPYFNELLIDRNESKQIHITRMLKRLNK